MGGGAGGSKGAAAESYGSGAQGVRMSSTREGQGHGESVKEAKGANVGNGVAGVKKDSVVDSVIGASSNQVSQGVNSIESRGPQVR